jgi:hypothetical protein
VSADEKHAALAIIRAQWRAIMRSSTTREIRFHSGVVSEKSPSLRCHPERPRAAMKMTPVEVSVVSKLPQRGVVAPPEERQAARSGSGAHAGDDFEILAGCLESRHIR